jgi:predicted nuclease of restriction endonuclease-like (RecB) superfamily
MDNQIKHNNFYAEIKSILHEARHQAFKKVNFLMVDAYWHIGKRIVEEEQKGEKRAEYGTYLLRDLAKFLTAEFGSGFSERNLRFMRQFYALFPIRNTLCTELTWSHYRLLIRVENKKARDFYCKEAVQSSWSVRDLERQINSLYYERLLSSKEKTSVIGEMKRNAGQLIFDPHNHLKDPYILEFLDLKPDTRYLEKDLETALINQMQKFLLELGRGFCFVERQKRIATETGDFYIDLVFYNYILKCFVLVDLKLGKLTHQNIGQMDMYVRMYEDKIRGETDNPTIGLILCAEKDETVVKYSILKEDKQVFAAKYQLYLPSEQELEAELKKEFAYLVDDGGNYLVDDDGNFLVVNMDES